jgi:ABC-type arginine/histidine transport system permease subunit
VFILEHYFASKSFAALLEAFNVADEELPHKTLMLPVSTCSLGFVLNYTLCIIKCSSEKVIRPLVNLFHVLVYFTRIYL